MRDAMVAALEAWFAAAARPLPWRRDYDPYAIWISEVMLQQTRVSVVLPYFGRFMERFPSITALAAAAEEEVLALWSGLGYYRRARMLHEGARYVVERFGGVLPRSAAQLKSIPGVGRYTAGAIASIGFDEREAIVDGNVARVVARLFALEGEAASPRLMNAAWSEAERLVALASSPRNFNQSLMELGALICTPRQPSCGDCAARLQCASSVNPEAVPPPKKRRAVEALEIPLYVVTDGTGRVLLRREEGALFRGLFHLPHGNDALFPSVDATWRSLQRLGSFRHTVTHRSIEFTVERAEPSCSLRETAGEWIFASRDELSSLPLPSYVRKALRIAIG